MMPSRPTKLNGHTFGSIPSNFQIPSKQRKIIAITKPTTDDGLIQTACSETLNNSGSAFKANTNVHRQNSVVPSTSNPSIPENPPFTHSEQFVEPKTNSANASSNATNEASNQGPNNILDIFSPVYIPLWLRAVNDSRADLQPCTPFPTHDFKAYIATLAGQDFAHEVLPVTVPPPVYSSIGDTEVDSHDYQKYWSKYLQNEFALQSLQNNTCNLYNHQLKPIPQRPGYFLLHVPGLRENVPRIDLGDMINVRLLHPPSLHIEAHVAHWEEFGKRQGAICPGFTGILYNPCVWEINRAKEMVTLRIDRLVSASNCNIIFLLQYPKLEPLYRAIGSAASSSVWLRRMLFPVVEDGVRQESLSQAEFDIPWKDDLNWEQKKVVHTILSANYGSLPYLVSGPPGTGKTKTLVETALQLLRKPGHVLICAPSDQAADTLALRLCIHLTPHELLRLNSWTRSFAEVPDRLLPYTHISELSFSLPPAHRLLSYRIVVTTCRDADLLNRARLTNASLFGLFNGVRQLLNPHSTRQPLHWTALLLDEAAQATEPEALIPLTVVMPPDDSESPQFLAAGDQYQLGPKVLSKSKLNMSLFQRLFERQVYSDHPLSRKYGTRVLTSAMLPVQRPPFTNLIRNYRSHIAILSVPSSLFYNDTLIPERNTSKLVLSWPGWPHEHWPVLFQQNSSEDFYESLTAGDGTGTGNLYNIGETKHALDLVLSLLSHTNQSSGSPISQQEIMIMSPFRAQVSHLRKLFRQNKLFDVNIGPLDAFQGLESRIVIICTTRTRLGTGIQDVAHHVLIDKSRALGIIDEPQRFNVALTRAQEGLIVIGNASCLTSTRDLRWLSFLDFCRRNNCFKAAPSFTWPDLKGPHKQGQLELALLYKALRRADGEPSRSLASGLSQRSGNASSFKLRGPRQDMDEEMWQLKELAQSYDSENVDLPVDLMEDEYLDHTSETTNATDDKMTSIEGGYDRNLRQEFQNECNSQ